MITNEVLRRYHYLKVMGLYESMVFLLAGRIQTSTGTVANLETYPWGEK